MSRVKGANTKPEWIVRRLLHGMGYRYRLYRKDLPGTPDIVFLGRRKAIFVHGCFWHRHQGCRLTTTPKTRAAFWKEKFEANEERDRRKFRELDTMGWRYLVIWQCETRDEKDSKRRLSEFLGPTRIRLPSNQK
uniref:Very short patch repair endonuclease n=1 Tax=Candidatus Kentrum sp. LFY TaxID=2126342 RepID=A0A450U834_9GAMM|nr:MAG: T/G mismatch-specific endonuclease [Candidatus Kentron sp. LFY]